MNEISQRISSFQAQQQSENDAIKQAAKAASEKLESDLALEWSESAKRISSAIREQSQSTIEQYAQTNAKIRKSILKHWMVMIWTLVVLLGLASGTVWALGWKIGHQLDEISQNRQALAELEAKGSKIQMGQCGKRLCVKLDQNSDGNPEIWRTQDGKNRALAIPLGY